MNTKITELTRGEEEIMQILWRLGDAVVNDIIARTDEPHPKYTTVATFLKILENKGFVARRKSQVDRRVQSLHITEQGLAYLDDLMPIWQEHEERLLSKLGGKPARDQLIGLLKRLYD